MRQGHKNGRDHNQLSRNLHSLKGVTKGISMLEYYKGYEGGD